MQIRAFFFWRAAFSAAEARWLATGITCRDTRCMHSWLILTGSLPASPSTLRVRIWRSLKATGCAPLRDGVYLLPATSSTAASFWASETALREAGCEAHMLEVTPRNSAQEGEFVARFDRREQYAELAQQLKEARRTLRSVGEPEARKELRQLGAQLEAIRARDFIGSPLAGPAAASLEALRREVAQRHSPGEPGERSGSVARWWIADVRGKPWATRARPWVDRLATAWLVRRRIDADARFRWLSPKGRCPVGAVGFDFDGAAFSHAGGRVTFEVVAESFALTDDAALMRLGELVHCVDIGGIPVDEAAGLEAVVRGLHRLHADDDALLEAALPVFDALHAAMGAAA